MKVKKSCKDFPADTGHYQTALIVLISLLTLLSALPMHVMLPSYPALADYFSISITEVPLFLTVFAVGFAASQVFAGPLSDRHGRKMILMSGLGLSLLAIGGCLLSKTQGAFLFFRLLQGVGCGCFVLSQALVQDIFDSSQRQNIRIYLITFSGICISISPLCGTVFQYAWGWQGSFFIAAALTTLLLLITWRTLKTEGGKAWPPSHLNGIVIKVYRKIFTNRTFVFSYLIAAVAFTSHFSFKAISPLIFITEQGLSDIEYSIVLLGYGVAYISGGLLASRFAKAYELTTQINIGLTLSGLSGAAMLLMLAEHPGVFSVIVPMTLCTLGTTMIRPAAVSRAMDVFSHNSGTAAAAGGTLFFVIGGVTNALLPSLPISPSWSVAGFVVIAAGVSLLLNKALAALPAQPIPLIETR